MQDMLIMFGSVVAFVACYWKYKIQPVRIDTIIPEEVTVTEEQPLERLDTYAREHNERLMREKRTPEEIQVQLRSIILDMPEEEDPDTVEPVVKVKRDLSWSGWIQNNKEWDKVRPLIFS